MCLHEIITKKIGVYCEPTYYCDVCGEFVNYYDIDDNAIIFSDGFVYNKKSYKIKKLDDNQKTLDYFLSSNRKVVTGRKPRSRYKGDTNAKNKSS